MRLGVVGWVSGWWQARWEGGSVPRSDKRQKRMRLSWACQPPHTRWREGGRGESRRRQRVGERRILPRHAAMPPRGAAPARAPHTRLLRDWFAIKHLQGKRVGQEEQDMRSKPASSQEWGCYLGLPAWLQAVPPSRSHHFNSPSPPFCPSPPPGSPLAPCRQACPPAHWPC